MCVLSVVVKIKVVKFKTSTCNKPLLIEISNQKLIKQANENTTIYVQVNEPDIVILLGWLGGDVLWCST